jgi:hypothetical protein
VYRWHTVNAVPNQPWRIVGVPSGTANVLVKVTPVYCRCTACAGVLYSLFGRNLDTGEAVAYSDEHWRNVVARLHLTKQQVRP